MAKKKILAVDDERSIVRLVQVNLERAGYEVVVAYNGKEALERVASDPPDLIVLDVMMPYIDGTEVLRHLKQDPRTRNIPIIMLTARANDADIFEAYRSGADCYLTKPFHPGELISFVKRILEFDYAEAGEKRYQL